MPGILRGTVHGARDLPVMDSTSHLTDAFAELKLGTVTIARTQVARKTLSPVWNCDFRYEADDEALQDEAVQVNVYDHDTLGGNDAIGQVLIDINPLLQSEDCRQISGWFPIFDTLKGIRGSLHLTLKLELFRDHHRFRDTSCGVRFFCTLTPPECYQMQVVRGFVEELIVDDDPEHQWIDRIRATRTSNQARQATFAHLANELQRKIGVKALEMGANAVLGYRQHFDLEGESGMVARGIGTAVWLNENAEVPTTPTAMSAMPRLGKADPAKELAKSFSTPDKRDPVMVQMPAAPTASLPTQYKVPLITMCEFPDGFLQSLGSSVCVRAVKLLDRMNNPDETDTRDSWWTELRNEIGRSAQQLGFNAVVGYSEQTAICKNICIISASGTAANINTDPRVAVAYLPRGQGRNRRRRRSGTTTNTATDDCPRSASSLDGLNPSLSAPGVPDESLVSNGMDAQEDEDLPASELSPPNPDCALFHLPQAALDNDVSGHSQPCRGCAAPSSRVPEIILLTVEPPPCLQVYGPSRLVQAQYCRVRKRVYGSENAAAAVGEAIPFIEYEIHRQLYAKMKLYGMNALFSLRYQLTLGENHILAVATATGVTIASLYLPQELQPASELTLEGSRRLGHYFDEMKRMSSESRRRIVEAEAQQPFQADSVAWQMGESAHEPSSTPSFDRSREPGNIVEMDDEINDEMLHLLMEDRSLEDLSIASSDRLPGLAMWNGKMPWTHLRTLTGVVSVDLTKSQSQEEFAAIFSSIYNTIRFKIRNCADCCLSSLRFDVTVPEDNELQVVTTVAVLSAAPASLTALAIDGQPSRSDVNAEASEHIGPGRQTEIVSGHPLMTPRNSLPGLRITRYLGPVVLHLIKETSSLKEAGGIGRFVQLFVSEVLAIAAAHVTARGGNVLLGYRIRHLEVLDNHHKNQAQCVIALQGDAALLFPDNAEASTSATPATPSEARIRSPPAVTDQQQHTSSGKRPPPIVIESLRPTQDQHDDDQGDDGMAGFAVTEKQSLTAKNPPIDVSQDEQQHQRHQHGHKSPPPPQHAEEDQEEQKVTESIV